MPLGQQGAPESGSNSCDMGRLEATSCWNMAEVGMTWRWVKMRPGIGQMFVLDPPGQAILGFWVTRALGDLADLSGVQNPPKRPVCRRFASGIVAGGGFQPRHPLRGSRKILKKGFPRRKRKAHGAQGERGGTENRAEGPMEKPRFVHVGSHMRSLLNLLQVGYQPASAHQRVPDAI